MQRGFAAFERIKAIGDRARSDFRSAWRDKHGFRDFSRSSSTSFGGMLHYAKEPQDYQTERIQISENDASENINAMVAELTRCNLAQYVGHAKECVDSQVMNRMAAETYLLERVGMKKGHLHKFIKLLWSPRKTSPLPS